MFTNDLYYHGNKWSQISLDVIQPIRMSDVRNILLVRQLTESWLNMMYVGKTETRILHVAKLTLGQLMTELT